MWCSQKYNMIPGQSLWRGQKLGFVIYCGLTGSESIYLLPKAPKYKKNKVSHFSATDDLNTGEIIWKTFFFIFLQDVAVYWRCPDWSKLEHWMLLCLMVELLQEDHRLGQTFSLPHSYCHSIIYCWYDLVRFTCLVLRNFR